MSTTSLRMLLGVLLMCLIPLAAWAGSINLVLPFPPAGAVDQLARDLEKPLARYLGEPVVVLNKPGAGGMVAIRATLTKRAGEQNFLMAHTGLLSLNPFLFRSADQRMAAEQLKPVMLLAQAPLLLLVRADSGLTSLEDLRAAGQQRRLRYGSAGIGTVAHLAGAQFAHDLGVESDHIPYRGAIQALTDLVGGEVDFMFELLVGSSSLLSDGRLRALAVAADSRLAQVEQIPTLAELGQPLVFSSWFGVVAPRDMSEHDMAAMQAALALAMEGDGMSDKLASKGMVVDLRAGVDFENFIQAQSRLYGPMIQRLGIQLD